MSKQIYPSGDPEYFTRTAAEAKAGRIATLKEDVVARAEAWYSSYAHSHEHLYAAVEALIKAKSE